MAKSFSDQIGNFVNKTEAKWDAIWRASIVELFDRLIDRTPSAADVNWTPAVNGQAVSSEAPLTPAAAKARVREVVAGFKMGDIVALLAKLEKIGPIEFGTSGQAPIAMIRLTAAEWQQIVDEATAKVKG